jgi:hypothetical protein
MKTTLKHNKPEPPLVLVRTWYELLLSADDDETREHAGRMLMGAFGSKQAIAFYLKKHNIIK